MDAYQCVITKLDVREFSSKEVSADLKSKILEAGRLTQSGNNSQHWRFILVQEKESLRKLARASPWGEWVERANFAVIVLTEPTHDYHMIDAGRVVQDMELAAWSFGVASCVFTGIDGGFLHKDFGVPRNLSPTIIVGFGYPERKLLGKKKNRKPLSEITFLEKYGKSYDQPA